jgi:hypothetical protein
MSVVRRLGRWLENVFLWWEFPLGVAAGVTAYRLAVDWTVIRKAGRTILITEGTVAVAVLAVSLTALSILVAFLSDEYVALLRRTEEGIGGHAPLQDCWCC